MDNYTIYHSHSDLSNLTAGTGADSVTKFTDYLDRAQELGMKSFALSEHGNVMSWIKKKQEIEKRGMKYIHANEVYLTQKIDKENGLIRDNFHYMMIAKNHDGVKELNQLTSNSFNRTDGHFYFNPRISFDELKNTSDNILMTSACLASPLWRLYNKAYNDVGIADKKSEKELEDLLSWMGNNKHRMFFEIQYHNHPQQIAFNQMLLRLSKELDIPLIAGTDTHSLDKKHAKTRDLFLKSKGANYGDSDAFDLTFKSHDELIDMFKKQNALPKNVYLEAIHNTNVMADMVEEFELDKYHKYPKMFDNPIEVFQKKINEGVVKRGINKFPTEKKKQYFDRIKAEFDTYVKLNAVDYMLLQKNIIDWCHDNDIFQGYGRGSVNGSVIAYVLGVTEMDSIKHKLNFFRFLNPDRVSMADIDVDFPPTRRQEVIDFVAGIEGIDFAEIITFNTKALKGSIRLVGKGLDIPLNEVDEIAKAVESFGGKDRIDNKWKKNYPELFEHVEVLNGVIESMGSHPSGFIVSPINVDTNLSTVYTKESKYRVTSVNMKELDGENYVKLDILGLDNIELINETCRMAGIERLTPDNINTDDLNVWKSLKESTLGVFQMESESASAYIKKLFSDETLNNIEDNVDGVSYIDLLSMANGAIRPSGNSYREELSNGIVKDNGHEALNGFLKPTLGQMIFQEQIMNFLTDFCGHTGSESDLVRRGLSKKLGTKQFLPKIESGFIKHMSENYGESLDKSKEILQYFLKVIENSSDYGFSINHSQPYSYIGYACAWLRYYYPLEFLTVSLNLQDDDKEKTKKIIDYAKKKNVEIKTVEFGKSRAYYSFNREENNIYKGIASIKFLNIDVAEELYKLFHTKNYNKDSFIPLLKDILDQTSANTRQMEILIRLDFFKEFGKKEILLEIYLVMADKKKANTVLYPDFADKITTETKRKRNKETGEMVEVDKEKIIKIPLKYDSGHIEKTKEKRLDNIQSYEQAVKKNPPRKIELYEQIAYEKENLGYAISVFPSVDDDIAIVLDINKKYTPILIVYKVNNGEEIRYKVSKKKFYAGDDQLLYVGDTIRCLDASEKNCWKKVDGEWAEDNSRQEFHLNKISVLRRASTNA